MKTIYKYDLTITDRQTIEMPAGAVILAIQQQNTAPVFAANGQPVFNNTLQLWALVDPDAALEPRTFAVIGTGNPVPDNSLQEFMIHAATVVTAGGALVWHVFQVYQYEND